MSIKYPRRICNNPVAKNRKVLINDVIDGGGLEKSSSCFDISDINSSFSKNKFNGTSSFHMNICPCHNFDELQTFLSRTVVRLNVTGITEPRQKKLP